MTRKGDSVVELLNLFLQWWMWPWLLAEACLLCTEGSELGFEGLASTGSLSTRHHGERVASTAGHLWAQNASFLWWLLSAVGDGQICTVVAFFFSRHSETASGIDYQFSLFHMRKLSLWHFCCCCFFVVVFFWGGQTPTYYGVNKLEIIHQNLNNVFNVFHRESLYFLSFKKH